MAPAMTPLVLIVGFLGAGKTRFLTELIPLLHGQGLKVRVLLNDFENADIDASRLNELDALVTPLAGECVCCTSLRELMDALHAVPAEPNAVMLIEANGATESDELLGYLTTDRRLAHFTLPLQLTVIDAGRWQKRWWHNTLEAAQVATATHLYLNWTDRLSAARQHTVDARLLEVNARAARTTPQQFATDLRTLADSPASSRDRKHLMLLDSAYDSSMHDDAAHMSSPRSHTSHLHPSHIDPSHAHPSHVPQSHSHPFATATWPLPERVDRAAFLTFVRDLPPAVVRAKGLVRFADRPNEMFVWNRIGGRKGAQLDRSAAHTSTQPVALFIGVGLPLAALIEGIAALSSTAAHVRVAT